MSLRLGARLLAALAPAAVLLVPTSAHADKVVTDDVVGDVTQVSWVASGEDSGEPVFTPAPDEAATDITRTVVAYGDTRLSITVHLRDLVLTSVVHETYVRVATPHGQYRATVGRRAGSRARAELARKSGREVECRGIRAAVDSQTDTVALSIPASCVGAPRWVQVGVGVVRVVEAQAGSTEPTDFTVYADDGHRAGDLRQNDVAKGPRVHRG